MKSRPRLIAASLDECAMALACALVFVGGVACAPPPGGARGETSAILGGSVDTTHPAVMASFQSTGVSTGFACSGSVIAQVGSAAFLLTAAHCVVAHDAMQNVIKPVTVVSPSVLTVLSGSDWQASYSTGPRYGVTAVFVAPEYDGATASPSDLAIIRFAPGSTLPLIPILEPANDTLAVGSNVTLVGYGQTEGSATNSVRRTVDRTISILTRESLTYDQIDHKGQCYGDSGGPALFQTSGGVRVAGVISYGTSLPETDCLLQGTSVRVSSLASFIHSVIDAAMPRDAGASPDVLAATDAGRDAAPEVGRADAGPPPLSCGKLTDPRPACAACVASRCCEEAAVCSADPLCLGGCGAKPMVSCLFYPPSAALARCLATCSGDPCGVLAILDAGVPPGDAATGDASPSDAPPLDASSGLADAADATSRVDAALDVRPDASVFDAGGPIDAPIAEARTPDAAAPLDGPSDAPARDAREPALARSAGCGCDAGGAPDPSSWRVTFLFVVAALWRRKRLVRARRAPLLCAR
ncbi:MAG TPA: trypsin-like serine protease [Polyangia bacterium]|nr:trypsin-like serine protease [Polyangia bacterium]